MPPPPHSSPFDVDVAVVGEQGGWNIELMSQPPFSPDLNTLDLGVLYALLAIQLKMTKNIDGLIYAVSEAFKQLPSSRIDKCFITLQKVMQCVMLHGGGHGYKLPHVSKELKGKPRLPAPFSVEEEIISRVLSEMNK
ncbi:hypothetical protein ON010_g492 [Phytophthora cinnamomi]|nr:hypothetical protein ON010_g492 [Phytophthora cinnamomi]